jgi:hypothetical protein
MTKTKAITFPELADGERYLCGTVNPDGSTTHSILLPGDNAKASQAAQLAWAKEQGGDLLNRVELVIAYETMPEEFQKDTYWSNTKHASGFECAWVHVFLNGLQSYSCTYSKLRARAVRRLTVQ